nr:NADH dehydrogenase subunit 6 [Tartessus sp.]
MKMIMIKMMIMTMSMIPFMKNPMSMGITLIIYTLIVTMMMNKIMLTSWFSMITFLMMIGGLMIIFMYMSSISSNEKFKVNIKLMVAMIVVMTINEEMMLNLQINEKQELMMFPQEQMSMMKLYSKKSLLVMIMLVSFLLMTMISVTKIVMHFKGPLRKKS